MRVIGLLSKIISQRVGGCGIHAARFHALAPLAPPGLDNNDEIDNGFPQGVGIGIESEGFL